MAWEYPPSFLKEWNFLRVGWAAVGVAAEVFKVFFLDKVLVRLVEQIIVGKTGFNNVSWSKNLEACVGLVVLTATTTTTSTMKQKHNNNKQTQQHQQQPHLLVLCLGVAVRGTVRWILREMIFPGAQHLARQWIHVMLQYTWLLDEFPTISTSTRTRAEWRSVLGRCIRLWPMHALPALRKLEFRSGVGVTGP